LPFPITPPTVSLTADKTAPQVVGTAITFTASALGVASPQYRFWMYDGVSWTVVRDWGASTFTWTPTVANAVYKAAVWVRETGTGGDPPEAYTSLPFAITGP
jgi:cell wall-associated protease